MPIIHYLVYLLQFKTFRTLILHYPMLDMVNIKSQQRNHGRTVTFEILRHHTRNVDYNVVSVLK